MEGKVAVLGSADFVMPFSALGVETFPTSDESEKVIETAEKIVQGNYALVVVAENVAAAAQEVFVEVENKPVPGIVVVPFTTASTGFATKALGEVLKMATGINIFSDA
ncbi:V-type ATP synthase subunit F [Planctomycetota bacterium]